MMLENALPFKRLWVSGKDAFTFLQGQFTLDLSTLVPGETKLSAYCSAKGKVQTTFWIALTSSLEIPSASSPLSPPSSFMLIIPNSCFALQKELLMRYGRFSKITFKEDDAPIYGLSDWKENSDSIKLAYSTRGFTFTPSLHTLSPQEWAAADIKEGFVLLENFLSDHLFPHYLNLVALQGIGFKKGCYLGQEIIARMEYRTEVKRHLYHVFLVAEGPRKTGDEIVTEAGKSVGVLVAMTPEPFPPNNLCGLAIIGDSSSLSNPHYKIGLNGAEIMAHRVSAPDTK